MEQELDLENPLTVYHNLYYDDVSSLFTNESDHMPRLLSFPPSDFRFSIRRTALSLIAQAKFSYSLDPFLVYLSINYVDRFLSRQEILVLNTLLQQFLILMYRNWEISKIQLFNRLRICEKQIILGKRYIYSRIIRSLFKQREGDFEFDANSVHRMENIILAALQWRMRSITPFSFLQYFLSFLNIEDSSFAPSLKSRASDIIFNVHHELKLLEYKPSIIAASALLCAVRDLNPLTFSSSKINISSCEYVNNSTLLECVGVMATMTEGDEASVCATMSGSSTLISVLDRQCTSSISEKDVVNFDCMETNSAGKRRRLNGLCGTIQISQVQQC